MAPPNRMRDGVPVIDFPAGTLNALTEDFYARKAAQKPLPSKPRRPLLSRIPVKVVNTTSSNVEYGQILGVDGAAFSLDSFPNNFYDVPELKGVAPSEDKPFVVALNRIDGTSEALPGGEAGLAVCLGYAWVLVNFTDEEHTHCKVDGGETTLVSSTSGHEILDHEEIPDPEYLPADVKCLVLLGGGGGRSKNLTKFAKVKESAGAGGDGIGKASVLNDEMQEASEDPEDYVEFKSANDVRCAVDVRIILHSVSNSPITPGSTFQDNPLWGTIVNVRDYLEELGGFGGDKVLASTGGIEWKSPEEVTGECVEVVTDVECSGDSLVITKETFILPGAGCEIEEEE